MERLERAAILMCLVEELRGRGSWCGETHIQKATYFLQELGRVPLGYAFILYKHGPFSFDLRDEITEMRADEFVRLSPQPYPYGPSIVPGPTSEILKGVFHDHIERHRAPIVFVAARLGRMGVTELERVATALFVTLKTPPAASSEERAQEIVRLKPHVKAELARLAVENVDRMLSDYQTSACTSA